MTSHKQSTGVRTNASHIAIRPQHSTTTSAGKKEGDNPGIEPHKLGRHSGKIMEDFEQKLTSASAITIQTKKKSPTETPLLGKRGCIVSIDTTTVGILQTPSAVTTCCNTYEDRDENDPLNYNLVNSAGDEIMTVCGLDDSKESDNFVVISTTTSKAKIGKIMFGYPGADGESISKATTLAGREDSFIMPVSVLDENGDLIYIFRRDPENPASTEILSADGQALTVAEFFINYKQKKQGGKISREPESGIPYSFTLNFIEISISIKERMLVLGVAITLFNQWLTRQQRSKKRCCTQCTII